MPDEARNLAILANACRRWADSKGASADHWISICDPEIRFGSIAEPLKVVAYTAVGRRRRAGRWCRPRKPTPGVFADGKAIEFFEFFDTAQVMQAMAPAWAGGWPRRRDMR